MTKTYQDSSEAQYAIEEIFELLNDPKLTEWADQTDKNFNCDDSVLLKLAEARTAFTSFMLALENAE
jgi:hypothetical protein